MNKFLLREAPGEKALTVPWDTEFKRRYRFDDFEIETLDAGGTVFRGDVAFSLVEEAEVS